MRWGEISRKPIKPKNKVAVKDIIPVDLHIGGCPPPPLEILKGLLALVNEIKK